MKIPQFSKKIFSYTNTQNKSLTKLTKKAGIILYLDARKTDGVGLPTNSPLPSLWNDLSGAKASYTFTNLLGLDGNIIDNNSDGLADNFTQQNTTSRSVSNNVQTFTATTQYGNIKYAITPVTASKYYACAYIEANSTNVKFGFQTGGFTSTFDSHVGSGVDFLSVLATANSTSASGIFVQDNNTSGFAAIKVQKVHVADITAMFGAGNEPPKAYMDIIAQNAISQYGYISTQTLLLSNDALATNFAGTTASGVDVSNPNNPFWVLDGTDDFFSLVNTPSLDITSAPFAICATIKPTLSQSGFIVAKNNGNDTGYQYGLAVTTAGAIIVKLGANSYSSDVGVIANNELCHIMFTLDSSGLLNIYKNLSIVKYNSSVSAPSSVSTNVLIGKQFGGTNFKGNLATLSLYSGILSSEYNVLRAEHEISKAYIT